MDNGLKMRTFTATYKIVNIKIGILIWKALPFGFMFKISPF